MAATSPSISPAASPPRWRMLMFNPTSIVPALGASGAIAGVLGCYMRLFPLARVIVLVPIIFIPLFFEVPAVVFAGLWFLIQVLQGTARTAPAVEQAAASPGGRISAASSRALLLGPLLRAARAAIPAVLPRRRRSRISAVGATMTCLHIR